jgi:hypothetical protein
MATMHSQTNSGKTGYSGVIEPTGAGSVREAEQPKESGRGAESSGRTTMRDVREDAGVLKEDVKALAHDTADVVSGAAGTATAKVKDVAGQASDLAKSAGDSAKKYHSATCERVKKHPTASLLVALGAGALLGRVFWRR